MSPITTIIFDLDGTLIDSSQSILAGFAGAFAAEGLSPVIALGPEIIGPPLKETLALLAGTTERALIDRLAERFKNHYDTSGYKETTVFAGVSDMLSCFHRQGVPLHIATNKRLAPTLKIVEHLKWNSLFGRIFALDAWAPPAANKLDMINWAIDELAINRESALYVGDRREDGEAATGNCIAFALAEWGYGTPEKDLPAQWRRFADPNALLSLVCNDNHAANPVA